MLNLKDIEKRAEEASHKVLLDTQYIPGEIESEDMYRAFNEEFEVDSYGQTEEQALESGRAFLKEYFIQNFSKIKEIN